MAMLACLLAPTDQKICHLAKKNLSKTQRQVKKVGGESPQSRETFMNVNTDVLLQSSKHWWCWCEMNLHQNDGKIWLIIVEPVLRCGHIWLPMKWAHWCLLKLWLLTGVFRMNSDLYRSILTFNKMMQNWLDNFSMHTINDPWFLKARK